MTARVDPTEESDDANKHSPQKQPSTITPPFGVHGLRLKRFEEVVAKLLAVVEPRYVRLPPPPPLRQGWGSANTVTDNKDNDDWLFAGLPSLARVLGNHPHPKRARKKEGQLRSMLRGILHLVPSSANDVRPTTLVDFGGGSGHLGIPLALLLPECKIIVVDFNKRSIELLHEKAQSVVREVTAEKDAKRRERNAEFASKFTATTPSSALDLRCCGDNASGGILGNLYTFAGPVEQFVGEDFDVAIALHLCGEATDVCLRRAIQHRAAAIVVAPCCVGKLSANAFNPDVYHATGQNEATVSYPQSQQFSRLLSEGVRGYKTQQDWNALAKAADYSDETEFRTSRNASRRIAKALLETDRRLFLEECGYSTALAKMDPLEVTPKNDILVAWRQDAYNGDNNHHHRLIDLFGTPDKDCEADIKVAKAHLLSAASSGEAAGSNESLSSLSSLPNKRQKQQQQPTAADRNDWTQSEEAEIRSTILAFLEKTCRDNAPNEILVFPTRMGGRRRKLIHFVAQQLNLAHWGQGKKVSEKTVAVARSRPPRKVQPKESSS